jgi:serine/threonine protein kinase
MIVPPEADLYIDATLSNRFEVQRYLNAGGFCLLFEGFDHQTANQVALKILSVGANASDIVEFENEALLLAALGSASHVVNLIHSGSDTIPVTRTPGGAVIPLPVKFLVLELADASLGELVIHRLTLDCKRRLSMFRDVVKGVHQMHLGDVMHRDIKADNALVFLGAGSRVTTKIADLGRSRDVRQAPRFAAADYVAGRGDLRFAPPEALWCQLDDQENSLRRADLYLLGSVLYELVTGQAITSSVFTNPTALANWNLHRPIADRATDYVAQTGTLRAQYEPAFAIFTSELPASIRSLGSALLRQVCDPDPERRERRFRREGSTDGLNWLLNRTDILIGRIVQSERAAAVLAARKTAGGTR